MALEDDLTALIDNKLAESGSALNISTADLVSVLMGPISGALEILAAKSYESGHADGYNQGANVARDT